MPGPHHHHGHFRRRRFFNAGFALPYVPEPDVIVAQPQLPSWLPWALLAGLAILLLKK